MAEYSLRRWTPVVLVSFVAAAYANALQGTFLFDDIRDVVENPAAKAVTFVAQFGTTNRPLTKATYAMQDALHGPWAAGFHAVNLAIHLVVTLIALVLVRRAAGFAGMRDNRRLWFAAAVVAVWTFHPALGETVTYVSGRSMELSALLMLTSLWAASVRQTAAARAVAFACAALAVLGRETALVLPAIVLAWQTTVQPPEDWAKTANRFVPAALGTALGAVLIALMPHHRELISASIDARTLLEALRGNLFAATEILTFWFEPWRTTILPAPPVIHGWGDAAALWRLALFAGAIAGALLLRRRLPLLAFGIALALLALVPSNTILWRSDPVGLKPLYLGGLGLTLALASGFAALGGTRSVGLVVTAAIAVALCAMTVERNSLFADPVSLWRDASVKTPNEVRPLIYLSAALMEAGRLDEADAAIVAAMQIDPFDEVARNAARLLAAKRGIDVPES